MGVVLLVARSGVGGSVATRWLGGVWFIETYFGGCGEFVVGKWYDISDGRVKPCSSSNTTRGVVDTHASGVQGVGVCGRV